MIEFMTQALQDPHILVLTVVGTVILFPIMCVIFGCLRYHIRRHKLEANPYLMTDTQYKSYNYKRFNSGN